MRGVGRREASVAGAVAALGVVLAVVSPGFFARDNLVDLFLGNCESSLAYRPIWHQAVSHH